VADSGYPGDVTTIEPPVLNAPVQSAETTESTPPATRVYALDLLRERYSGVFARLVELVRFGSVGALAFVVDLGIFNLLCFGPGELMGRKPLTAKVISVAVATVVAWLGNRYWTFQGRRTETKTRELMGFAVVNIGGLLIGVGCLAFSHYVLDLRTPLADNISANGVGLLLGTAFRYVAYRRFVFVGSND
jgi:putative flippase GtrA